jgi:DNA-binding response OmpR family regulator
MLILIVEDEAAIARFLTRGLNAHGHRSSARTTVKRVRGWP